MIKDPALRLQNYLVFGEFGEVNPSISDSSTFTFLTSEKMTELFEAEIEGCFLYSRHLNPSTNYLAEALALMENTEAAIVTGSGMAAISSTILQICSAGDEIISGRTIYGGSYALMKNFLPKLNINTHFVNILDLDEIKSKINKNTKIIYCEAISNPLLEVADIVELRKIADKHNIKLIVDNTFSPMMLQPYNFGAHIVVHSLTKFINGASDCVGGAICADKEFIASLRNVNDGATMLLGPVLDSLRASSILKNLRTLHIRMHQHSKNAMFVAENLEKLGLKVIYPGLASHPQHNFIKTLLSSGYGFGGMITFDAKTKETADKLLIMLQERNVGYFAVSLGFYKTLFSAPGSSTSSEIPKEEQEQMGLSDGLVRFSVGLDNNIEETFEIIKQSLKDLGLIK
ncbi:MAG: aminotransferase class I/II-fold pyridoxal phosphate-dependent enzyme [Ignavibacteria bacterium]|nr:aminotransferase class I/II-fold pyridoxal phosphate-dependent enzyme [Ignavibacteria bacterium]